MEHEQTKIWWHDQQQINPDKSTAEHSAGVYTIKWDPLKMFMSKEEYYWMGI